MLRRLAQRFGVTLDELCDRTPAEAPDGAASSSHMAVMTRAFRQMTAAEQEQLLAVGRALFAHAFEEET